MISTEAVEYLEDHAPDGASSYLEAGDGFRVVHPATPAGQIWESIFAGLVEQGYMRRSRTGRYWWL